MKTEEIKELVSNWREWNTVSVELYADNVLHLLAKLEIAEKALGYIEGFHIRGVEDQHLEIIRLKATEFLKAIRE